MIVRGPTIRHYVYMWVYDTIVGEVLPADIVNAVGVADLNRDGKWKEQALGCKMRSRCAQEVKNSWSYDMLKFVEK